MKKIIFDSVLTEVHLVKDAISAEFGHDVTALCEHLRALGKNTKAKASLLKRTALKLPRRKLATAKQVLIAKG